MKRVIDVGAASRVFDVGHGRSVTVRQHFFDRAVPQPIGSRKTADGTGLKIWPTSMAMLQHLQNGVLNALQTRLKLTRPLRIIELGSGCGLLGLGLAATCDNVEIVLTDPDVPVNYSEDDSGSTLAWLEQNLELNREVVGDRARVAKLAWGDAADTAELRSDCSDGFDLVIGSDLIYDPDRYVPLTAALNDFACSSPEAQSAAAAASSASASHDSAATAAILGYPSRHGGEKRFFAQLTRATASGGEFGSTQWTIESTSPLKSAGPGGGVSGGGTALSVTHLALASTQQYK